MFDEVRLDLHGVCNLSHVLTIKIGHPHLETEEDSSAVPFPFLVNFKLKRERNKQLKVCLTYESRHTCLVADCTWEAFILQMHRLHQAKKQHGGVCLFTSIIKDQTAKARILGIKCVFFLVMNFDSFCLCLHVAMKSSFQ